MSCGRDEVRAWIAPTAIAREHIRYAFFDRAIMAIPMHVAIASRRYGAPGRLGGSNGLQAQDQSSKSDSTSQNYAQHFRYLQFWSVLRAK
jgi:hypothetical protein